MNTAHPTPSTETLLQSLNSEMELVSALLMTIARDVSYIKKRMDIDRTVTGRDYMSWKDTFEEDLERGRTESRRLQEKIRDAEAETPRL